jgi:PEP-utilising enzyme, mobile domain
LIEHPFIRELGSLDRGTTATLGRLASDLSALAQAGLASAPTFTILPPVFREWQEHGDVPSAVVDALLSADFGALSLSQHLMIRAIVQVPFNGLDDKIRVERSHTALSNGIQRIYRSWGSSVARGNRAVQRIPDESSIPTILIQSFIENPCSIITRHAIRGSLTSAVDYSDNINNRVPMFTDAVSNVVSISDRTLLRPLKITFAIDTNSGNPFLLSVTDETMTGEGLCRALLDLLKNGRIDDARFLRGFGPDRLGYVSGYELDTSSTSAHVSGLPASPGIAHAQLAFRPPTPRPVQGPKRDPFIFVVEEATPDDIHHLEASSGAVGLRGGMTSHLAMACRGMGIPAVTNCGGRIDYKARVLHLEGGGRVAEFSMALVDGNIGKVGFGPKGTGLRRKWEGPASADELRGHIVAAMARIESTGTFPTLPIEDQLHISELKFRLKQMEVVP